MEKNFTRQCPDCGTTLFYTTKKHRLAAEKINSSCRNCSRQRKIITPKEEWICFTCGAKWMDWRSQISNPKIPFCSKQCWYDSQLKSLVGQKFGYLQVICRDRRNQTTFYQCLCACGNTTTVTHSNLISGACSSCGCLVAETRGSERKPLEEVLIKSIFNTYKRNAKDRNYEWSLSKEEVTSLVKGKCFYCGSLPSNNIAWRYKHEIASLPFNGIDRVDNTIGYTIDNCVSCCKICNSAKGTLTFDEFRIWALKLASNLPSSFEWNPQKR